MNIIIENELIKLWFYFGCLKMYLVLIYLSSYRKNGNELFGSSFHPSFYLHPSTIAYNHLQVPIIIMKRQNEFVIISCPNRYSFFY